MSRTRKPCPGCGDVDTRRAASDVCSKCRQKLDELLPALLGRVDKARTGRELYAHHRTSYWNPQFYGNYSFLHSYGRDLQRELLDAFTDLVEVVGERREPERGWTRAPFLLDARRLRTHTRYEPPYGAGVTLYLYPEQRIAFQRMFAAIEEALASTFAQGKVEGQEVIQQMLTGELSMKDMNEMVVTGEAE